MAATVMLLPLFQGGQPGFRSVPVVELTIHALLIVVLVSAFIGFYIGVRINRPRFLE